MEQDAPLQSPPPVLATPPAAPVPAPAPEPSPTPAAPAAEPPKMAEGGQVELGGEEKANWKFTSKDVIAIIFFAGGIASFVVAVNYYRQRRKMLIGWQSDTNDELVALKGKVKTIESKVKTTVQKAAQNVESW